MDWKDVQPEVTEVHDAQESPECCSRSIVESPYFSVRKIDLRDTMKVHNSGSSFHVVFVLEGEIEISGSSVTETLGPCTTCLLPAGLPVYSMMPVGGSASCIRVSSGK